MIDCKWVGTPSRCLGTLHCSGLTLSILIIVRDALLSISFSKNQVM